MNWFDIIYCHKLDNNNIYSIVTYYLHAYKTFVFENVKIKQKLNCIDLNTNMINLKKKLPQCIKLHTINCNIMICCVKKFVVVDK